MAAEYATIISTHTLTWSVTMDLFAKGIADNISTHTLTWSVTVSADTATQAASHFNSHAHVERDTLETLLECCNSHFNSHAHVERDQGISL